MSETVFKLPIPPSVNALFFNRKQGGRACTPAYDAWKTDAGWRLKAQHPAPVVGPVTLSYEVEDGCKKDLGNLEKPLTDLLVTHRLIADDKPAIVRGIWLAWSDIVEGVRVTIRPAAERPF